MAVRHPAKGRGKKRIARLAEWHWEGGDAGENYCANACGYGEETRERCGECVYRRFAPQTIEAEDVWEALKVCGGQVRVGGGGMAPATPFALDYGAVMTFAAAREVDLSMVADVLPVVESAIIASFRTTDETDGENS